MINPLSGKRLRYLIGADADDIKLQADVVTVLPYDYDKPARNPLAVGYCNLFWQRGAPDCAPYLESTDTAEEYDERVIDPRGPGWLKNLNWQFSRWKKLGVLYVELDNADAYSIAAIVVAIDTAQLYGLKVIAKNPGNVKRGALEHVSHPNIYGMIVEKGAGSPREMNDLRRDANKPDLPIWFVAFGKGKAWANDTAKHARNYHNMGVTYCDDGEYETARDILIPH